MKKHNCIIRFKNGFAKINLKDISYINMIKEETKTIIKKTFFNKPVAWVMQTKYLIEIKLYSQPDELMIKFDNFNQAVVAMNNLKKYLKRRV